MENEQTKKKVHISEIVKTALFVIFAIIAIFSISASITAKKQGKDAASIFHHQIRLVITDSMSKDPSTDVSNYKIKSLPVNSMVFIQEVPEDEEKAYTWYSNIEIGDVLTFAYKYDEQIIITHRVIDITPIDDGNNKGFVFSLMGDNKGSSTNPGVQIIDTTEEDSFNYIIGKVVGRSVVFGFLTTKTGLCIVIIIPALTLLIYEVIKITHILSANKKEKLALNKSDLEIKNDEQQEEIERLKRELEKLKNEQRDTDVNKEDN